ncbi:MAG: hypothetical protein HUK21_13010, partial [Fibrobacteraceae bacterium]|nr:hypothetical protein [Fibrobacteraceae bacterium]
LYLTTRILDFKPFKFLKEVLPSVLLVTMLSTAISYFVHYSMCEGPLRLVAVVAVSAVSTITFALMFGVKKEIRTQLLNAMKNKLGRSR